MVFRLSVLVAGFAMAGMANAATEIDLSHTMPTWLKQSLTHPADNRAKLEMVRTDTDFNQTTHTRFRQTWDGIPVWGAAGVIHTPTPPTTAKHLLHLLQPSTTLNGKIYDNLAKDLASLATPVLTPDTQKTLLRQTASLYAKKTTGQAVRRQKPSIKKIIFVDDTQKAHYAWLISFEVEDATGLHRPTWIMDSQTGKVWRQWEVIDT